jgi:hypothetical protein
MIAFFPPCTTAVEARSYSTLLLVFALQSVFKLSSKIGIAAIWSAVRVAAAARDVGDVSVAGVDVAWVVVEEEDIDVDIGSWVAVFWKKGAMVGVGTSVWLGGVELSDPHPVINRQASG